MGRFSPSLPPLLNGGLGGLGEQAQVCKEIILESRTSGFY